MHNFLLLTDLVEGGEWFAINRLLKITKEKLTKYHFFLVGFGNSSKLSYKLFNKRFVIKHANPRGRFGFFKSLYKDFKNLRNRAIKIGANNRIGYYLVVDYISALVALSLRNRKSRIIFLFHGTRSLPIKTLKDFNYRQILIKLLERLSILASDIVITPSKETKKYLLNQTPISSLKNRIIVVPNIVPDVFFVGSHSRFSSIPKILYSGRLRYYKGSLNLLNGYLKYLREVPDSILTIAYPTSSSEKKLESQLKRFIQKNKLMNHVYLIKDPSTLDLINIYKSHSVLFLPSELENSPLSVLESLASGTPIVGTDTGDMKHYINKLDPNLLLKNNSPEEIYRKMKYFFSIPLPHQKTLSIKSKLIVQTHSEMSSFSIFKKVIGMLEY